MHICSQTECNYWMQTNFFHYWMQHNSLDPKSNLIQQYMYFSLQNGYYLFSHLVYYLKFIANLTKVLDTPLLPTHKCMYSAKLNVSIGCRQIDASIGCSITLCLQSFSSSFNCCNKAKYFRAYMQLTEYKY